MNLNPSHPAVLEGRTIHTKTRRIAGSTTQVLKAVSSNQKLGADSAIVTKGRWAGMPMFSLSLEERATCPKSCLHWRDCYGNNMPFAHRFSPGDDLTSQLEIELANLARIYRHGFVVRLHVLGDFYSRKYVQFWRNQLAEHPQLRVFGYSARTGAIASSIDVTRHLYPDRWWIRYSRNEQPHDSNIYAGSPGKTDGIVCPQQTGKTASCTTCGLCWSMNQTVLFETH